MPTTTVEVFSISAAAILTPAGQTGASLYGCQSGTITLNEDDYALSSDDWIQGYWSNIKDVTLQVISGFISFQALAYITGTHTLSSAGAPDDYYATPLWPQYQANSPPVTMVVRCPSKDSTGSPGTVDLVLYQVYLYGVEPAGSAYKEGVTATFNGQAVPSWYDDQGNRLADRTFGRVLSWANQHTSFTSPIGTVYQIRHADTASANDASPTLAIRSTSTDTAHAASETDHLTTIVVPSADTAGTHQEVAVVAVSDTESAQASDLQFRETYASPPAILTGTALMAAIGTPAIAGTFVQVGYGQLMASATTSPGGSAFLPGFASLTGGDITTTITTRTRSPGSAQVSGSAPAISALSTVRTNARSSLSGSATMAAASPTGGSLTLMGDVSTPAPTLSSLNLPASATSNVFAPPAQTLVVVPVTFMYLTSVTDALTCTDSSGQQYISAVAEPATNSRVSCAVFVWYYPAAPGSISVTVTSSNLVTSASALLSPRVLDGAASLQASAATAVSNNSGEVTITTTQLGSWVFLAAGNNANGSGAAVGNTYTIAFWSDYGSGDDGAAGWVVTSTNGLQAAAGFSSMVRCAALEVLHG